MTRFRALFLPGGVLPAALAYPDLVRALGPEVDARYKELHLDLERLRSFRRPVLYVTGGKSNPVENEPIVERMGKVFPDFTREIYEDRHHFDPPHRAEPERFAASLKTLWKRAAMGE